MPLPPPAEHDFKGAETTVRRYVRQDKQDLGLDGRMVYIPSAAEAGVEAEVDWGSCRAIIAGKEMRLRLFCMRSKYSGKHFLSGVIRANSNWRCLTDIFGRFPFPKTFSGIDL